MTKNGALLDATKHQSCFRHDITNFDRLMTTSEVKSKLLQCKEFEAKFHQFIFQNVTIYHIKCFGQVPEVYPCLEPDCASKGMLLADR